MVTNTAYRGPAQAREPSLYLVGGALLGSVLYPLAEEATVADLARGLTDLSERLYLIGALVYLSLYLSQIRGRGRRDRDPSRRALWPRPSRRRRRGPPAAEDRRASSYSSSSDGTAGSYVMVPLHEAATTANTAARNAGHVDLTGKYRLARNVGFDKFLEAQGVGWALRRAAGRARPVHRISHRGGTVRIRISGIVAGDTTYEVGGPPVLSRIRDRTFEDTVRYLDAGDGIQVTKVAMGQEAGCRILVTRQLSADRMRLTMRSRAVFDDGRDSVEAVQEFDRIG